MEQDDLEGLVGGDEDLGVTDDVMPEDGGVETPADDGSGDATTTPAPSDADEKLRELDSRWQTDFRRFQGVMDQKLAAAHADFKEREASYRQQIRELETKGMDETARTKYEAGQLARDYQELQRSYAALQQQIQANQQMQSYASHFISMGVDPAKLDYSSLQALNTSGWAQIQTMLKQRGGSAPAGEVKVPQQKGPVKPDPKAPRVITPKGATPGGPTWADLIKQYGSREAVYRLVETGVLEGSIIPLTD